MLGEIGTEGQTEPGTAQGASLGLVLGAGGIRGIAHIGVLMRLWEAGVRPGAILGTSSGALVAAAYAALGWDPERLAALASRMGPLAILDLALSRPLPLDLDAIFPRRRSWVAPILEEMGQRGFDDLHQGVRHLGINCFDAITRREVLFVTGGDRPQPSLRDAVLGSSALPIICPSRIVTLNGTRLRLLDGGLVRTLCVDAAFGPPVLAGRVLAVDLGVMTGSSERALDHRERQQRLWADRLRVVRPPLDTFGTIIMRREDPGRLLEAGRRAVDEETLAWCRGSNRSS